MTGQGCEMHDTKMSCKKNLSVPGREREFSPCFVPSTIYIVHVFHAHCQREKNGVGGSVICA